MAVNQYDAGFDWAAAGGAYPTMSDSVGMAATHPQTFSGAAFTGGALQGGSGDSHPSAQTAQGNPVTGAIIFIGFVFVLMLIVHHFGKGDESFKHIKPSIYDVVLITLAAMAGIPLFKTLVAALANVFPPLGPVNTYVSAA